LKFRYRTHESYSSDKLYLCGVQRKKLAPLSALVTIVVSVLGDYYGTYPERELQFSETEPTWSQIAGDLRRGFLRDIFGALPHIGVESQNRLHVTWSLSCSRSISATMLLRARFPHARLHFSEGSLPWSSGGVLIRGVLAPEGF
jgi:hypothetical protein